MNIALESDIYEPVINTNNNYEDYVPPSSKFANGLRCPCGARKEHVFDNRQKFTTHIKSKTHQKWLLDLNTNKMNYYVECEKLRELVNSQKIIIAKLEKELNVKMKTVDYLTQQLMAKECENGQQITDLINFD
jgi:hypothetical protein